MAGRISKGASQTSSRVSTNSQNAPLLDDNQAQAETFLGSIRQAFERAYEHTSSAMDSFADCYQPSRHPALHEQEEVVVNGDVPFHYPQAQSTSELDLDNAHLNVNENDLSEQQKDLSTYVPRCWSDLTTLRPIIASLADLISGKLDDSAKHKVLPRLGRLRLAKGKCSKATDKNELVELIKAIDCLSEGLPNDLDDERQILDMLSMQMRNHLYEQGIAILEEKVEQMLFDYFPDRGASNRLRAAIEADVGLVGPHVGVSVQREKRISDTHALFVDHLTTITGGTSIGDQDAIKGIVGASLGYIYMRGYDGYHKYARVLARELIDTYFCHHAPGVFKGRPVESHASAISSFDLLKASLKKADLWTSKAIRRPTKPDRDRFYDIYSYKFGLTGSVRAVMRMITGKVGYQKSCGEAIKYQTLLDAFKGEDRPSDLFTFPNGLLVGLWSRDVLKLFKSPFWKKLTQELGIGGSEGNARDIDWHIDGLVDAFCTATSEASRRDAKYNILNLRGQLIERAVSQSVELKEYYRTVNRLRWIQETKQRRKSFGEEFKLLWSEKAKLEKKMGAKCPAQYVRAATLNHVKLDKLINRTLVDRNELSLLFAHDKIGGDRPEGFDGKLWNYHLDREKIERPFAKPKISFTPEEYERHLLIPNKKPVSYEEANLEFQVDLSSLGVPIQTTIGIKYEKNNKMGVPDYEGNFVTAAVTLSGQLPGEIDQQLLVGLVPMIASELGDKFKRVDKEDELNLDDSFWHHVAMKTVSSMKQVRSVNLINEGKVQFVSAFRKENDNCLSLMYVRTLISKGLHLNPSLTIPGVFAGELELSSHYTWKVHEELGTDSLDNTTRMISATRFWRKPVDDDEMIWKNYASKHSTTLGKILKNIHSGGRAAEHYENILNNINEILPILPEFEKQDAKNKLERFSNLLEQYVTDTDPDREEYNRRAAIEALSKVLFLNYDSTYTWKKEREYKLKFLDRTTLRMRWDALRKKA